MVIKAGREGSALIGILSPARNRYQGYLATPCLVPNALGQLVAAQIGHPNIKHTDVRPNLLRQRQSLRAAMSEVHLVTGMLK